MDYWKKWFGSWFSLHNNYLLPGILIALWIVKTILESASFAISDFSQIVPSGATFDNFDVDKRLKVFYLSVFSLMAAIILMIVVSGYLNRFIKDSHVLNPWKHLSLLGIIILFCDLAGIQCSFTSAFIGILFVALLVFQLGNMNGKDFKPNEYNFVWMVTLALSLCLAGREIYFFTGGDQPGNVLMDFSFAFLTLFIIFRSLNSFLKIPFKIIFFVTTPLILVPLLSVISDEVYLIFNQRNLLIGSDEGMFIFILTLSYGVFLFIYFTFNRHCWTINNTIRKFVLPIGLLGIYFFLNYQPFTDQPVDLFEFANPANGIMRIFVFREWPIAGFLSSHLLAELFFPSLYNIFNAFTGDAGFVLYRFMYPAFMMLISLYFLSKVFMNPLAVFAGLLIIPVVQIAFPGSTAMAFLSVFIFYGLYRNYSFRHLLLFLFFNGFLIVWKIEIGLASFVASGFLVAWMIITSHSRKKMLLDLGKALSILTGVVILLLAYFVFVEKIDISSHFMQAKAYFGANQEHGHSVLTFGKTRLYHYHYFIFPIIITVLIMVMVFRESKRINPEKRFLFIALLFLSIYYLVSAQRGLVRHSMAENTDSYMSSFLFLLLPLYLYYFIPFGKNGAITSLLFFILLVHSYKVSGISSRTSVLEDLPMKYQQKDLVLVLEKKTSRLMGDEKFQEGTWGDIKALMDDNFEENASFIDFSNTPGLYFYTLRKVPSYFCQYLQNTVTPELQLENLKLLKNMNLPVVVFSNIPQTFFDNTDGVPNTVRYSVLRRYIYQNYVPLGQINRHWIWIRKDIEPDHLKTEVKEYKLPLIPQKLKYFPSLKAKETGVFNDTLHLHKLDICSDSTFVPALSEEQRISASLHLNIENNRKTKREMTIEYRDEGEIKASFSFWIVPGVNDYVLDPGSDYHWITGKRGSLIFHYERNAVSLHDIFLFQKSFED